MTIHDRIATVTRKPSTRGEAFARDNCRRWASRKAAHHNGQLLFDGITAPYDCIVRDISSAGVKLEMIKNKYNPDGVAGFIPTYFSLFIPLDRTHMDCQTVWRRGSLVGARFLSAVKQMPLPANSRMMKQKT